MVGGGSGEHGQYQLQVDVAGAAFTLDRLFVEVVEISAADGSEIHKVVGPVILGTRIVSGDAGYREQSCGGERRSGAFAEATYGNGSELHRIVRANPHLITDTDLIFPGQVLRLPTGS